MVEDCPVKAMRDDLLVNLASSNYWDFERSDEAKRVTQREQMHCGKQRQACESCRGQ